MATEVEKWDKDQIKRLAQVSGRPLEVECAEAFLKAKWHVRLGTYYTDIASEKIRELDFLAERDFRFNTVAQNHAAIIWKVRLRILGSCKGFAAEQGPATYSVAAQSQAIEKPHFNCYECGIHGRNIANSMSRKSAETFLRITELSSARQVIGFDIIHRKEDQKNPPQVEYLRKTDRDLYEGLDCAIKAAAFWYQEDKRQNRRTIGGDDHAYITLNIPLLVSSRPFWDVSIDQGTAGDPELKSYGFHVSLYPSGDSEKPPEPIMSILCEAGKMEELTRHLNNLFDYFIKEVQLSAKS